MQVKSDNKKKDKIFLKTAESPLLDTHAILYRKCI